LDRVSLLNRLAPVGARIEGIDPELILKVTLVSPVQEDTWRTAGFKVLAQEKGGILVLFNDDVELKLFRERLDQYKKGASEDQKNPAYNTLFSAIEDVGSVTPEDRIGPSLRADGIATVTDIEPAFRRTIVFHHGDGSMSSNHFFKAS
jgi:hypothetical protein